MIVASPHERLQQNYKITTVLIHCSSNSEQISKKNFSNYCLVRKDLYLWICIQIIWTHLLRVPSPLDVLSIHVQLYLWWKYYISLSKWWKKIHQFNVDEISLLCWWNIAIKSPIWSKFNGNLHQFNVELFMKLLHWSDDQFFFFSVWLW